jgi:hypothetical protein
VPFPVTLPLPEVQELRAVFVVEQLITFVVEGKLPGAPATIPQVIAAPGASTTTTCRF